MADSNPMEEKFAVGTCKYANVGEGACGVSFPVGDWRDNFTSGGKGVGLRIRKGTAITVRE